MRSARSRRGWRRGGDRRPRERGRPGTTGEVGGRERRLEVAPTPAAPGSRAVEAGGTGRGRRRTSGLPAQTETTDVTTDVMTDAVTLPGVAPLQPGVARPGAVHLLPGKVAAAPGGGRDRTGQTALHPDVTGDSRTRAPGDEVEQLLEVAEILVTEDLHPGVMLGMVEMVHPDALLTVMSGGVEEVEEVEAQIGLHPAEEDVIVTLVVPEQADEIAILVPETLRLPGATPDLEMTDPRTGVLVRPAVETVDLSLERRDREKRDLERSDQENDLLASQMRAGPKSSVNPFLINTYYWGRTLFLRWKFS